MMNLRTTPDAIRDYLMIIHSLEVDITDNPVEMAIQSGQLFSYDCLVVDYDMPDMDGITLLKAIRMVDPRHSGDCFLPEKAVKRSSLKQ